MITTINQLFDNIQAIPEEMEFDPNSTPPCYKTADSVSCILKFMLTT